MLPIEKYIYMMMFQQKPIYKHLQTMTALPVHLRPSKAGQAICAVILVIVLILYRWVPLSLNCVGQFHTALSHCAAFFCTWPSWRPTRTATSSGRWRRRWCNCAILICFLLNLNPFLHRCFKWRTQLLLDRRTSEIFTVPVSII